jgi:hypothetical protein
MASYKGSPLAMERGWKLIRVVDMGLRKERQHLRWQEYMYHVNEAHAWLTHKAIRQSLR